MIPNTDATNHMSFKINLRHVNTLGTTLPMENEINAMAQIGWQLNQIVALENDYVLLVYIGFVDMSPDAGAMEVKP